jgi:hypothetical protein
MSSICKEDPKRFQDKKRNNSAAGRHTLFWIQIRFLECRSGDQGFLRNLDPVILTQGYVKD